VLPAGNENSIYGQEANARNEVRGERGYQQSLAEQAIAQRIAQNQMEQGQQQQNFGDAATLYGLGNLNDPTNAYQNAAGLASGEAASSSADVGALLRAYLAQRRNPVPEGTEMAGFGSGLAHALTQGYVGAQEGMRRTAT
jgi:hypothetical protein